MAERRKRGPYAKTAAVQARLISAAADTFRDMGYQAATMAEVARRAEISHTGLLHHFATKEDLLVAVLAQRDEQVATELGVADDRLLSDADDPVALLHTLAARSASAEDRTMLELDAVLAGEAASPDHPAHTALARRQADTLSFFRLLCEHLAEQGRLRDGVSAETAALLLMSTGDGLRRQWLLDPSVPTTDVLSTLVTLLVPKP